MRISSFESTFESSNNGGKFYTPVQPRYRLSSMDQKDNSESKLEQKNKKQRDIRNVSLYDTNMSHSLQVMEKILNSK